MSVIFVQIGGKFWEVISDEHVVDPTGERLAARNRVFFISVSISGVSAPVLRRPLHIQTHHPPSPRARTCRMWHG